MLENNESDPFKTAAIDFDDDFIEPAVEPGRKLTTMDHMVHALVARSMTRSEVVQNEEAVKAVQKEWQQ